MMVARNWKILFFVVCFWIPLTLSAQDPDITNVSLSNDGSDSLAFSFDSNEQLDSIAVTVDGPNGATYSFDQS
ncbi:MAG: hypothetical protein V5A59_11330, partial [Bacteroidales bacterium]